MDFSHETLITCLKMIPLRWTNWSKHYKQHLILLPYADMGLTLYKGHNYYYLRNPVDEIAKIPLFLAQTMMNDDKVTQWYGPYTFINNFENTKEGRYLIETFQYLHQAKATKVKTQQILKTYAYWVQTDNDLLEVIEKWRTE